jgi:hypothetical protein
MEVGQQPSFNDVAAVSLLLQLMEYERQQQTATVLTYLRS